MKDEQRSMFRLTRALLGLPCWGVKRGYGSFLTLEFGEPQLRVREPIAATSGSIKVRRGLARRHVVVHGAWHLWIYCCDWRVESAGKTIGDASTPRRIDAAARALDGQKLIGITLAPRGARTKFIFDLVPLWKRDRMTERVSSGCSTLRPGMSLPSARIVDTPSRRAIGPGVSTLGDRPDAP